MVMINSYFFLRFHWAYGAVFYNNTNSLWIICWYFCSVLYLFLLTLNWTCQSLEILKLHEWQRRGQRNSPPFNNVRDKGQCYKSYNTNVTTTAPSSGLHSWSCEDTWVRGVVIQSMCVLTCRNHLNSITNGNLLSLGTQAKHCGFSVVCELVH